MQRRRVAFLALALLCAALGRIGLSSAHQQQSTPPQGAIRTGVTMVPLDVRVLDARGNPVSDLKKEDFTVLEDGALQAIAHFSTQALTPMAPPPAGKPALRRAVTADVAAQNKRVFLILLGRGRMQGPSKELPALVQFVRARLLPQDYAAVLAYNRATDFTTDHARLATIVERFGERHEKIEQMLDHYFSGLRAVYGSKEIPAHIQAEIDQVFSGALALRPREIRPGQITDRNRIHDDTNRVAANLQRAEILRDREVGGNAGLPDPEATGTAEHLDLSFEEYVADQAELMQDLGNLYAAIDYLRYLDGEKHLVLITPRGLSLPRIENDRNIAIAAADARVAVDIVHTAGPAPAPVPRFSPTGRTAIIGPPVASPAAVFRQTFDVRALQFISEQTGGQATAFREARYAFEHLDAATKFQYLIGYYPTNTNLNGALRKIAVRVNRPGLTLLYRRGYYASQQLVPLDRRAFLTHTRIAAAARYQDMIRDIEVTLKPPTITGRGEAREIVVDIAVRSSRIAITEAEGRHLASIDIAIYCGDSREQVVCEASQKMDLKLSDDSLQRFLKEGAGYTARLTLTGDPRYVKVIAYDYGSDVLGTATVKLK